MFGPRKETRVSSYPQITTIDVCIRPVFNKSVKRERESYREKFACRITEAFMASEAIEDNMHLDTRVIRVADCKPEVR